MAENHAKRFYDRISRVYDLIADSGEHVARERGLALLDVQPGESVLEIGFGTGHSLIALAESVGKNGHVTGIDISNGMRDVAAERIANAGYQQRIDLAVAEVPPVPSGDSQFDAVSMSFTLELFSLKTIPAVLKECRRVLNPSGRIGVVSMATPAPGESERILERTYVWLHTHFPHIVDCQPIPLESLLSDADFKIIALERLDLFTMPVAIAVAEKSGVFQARH